MDAVKFVRGSSLRTAARHSHVTTQRDWSATLVGDMALQRAYVEVQQVPFSAFYDSLCLFSDLKANYFLCSSTTAKSDGRTCEYNNKIYQNGEIFRPNCKHQCTCMDGAVGCVSLCPHELMLPKVGCAKPKRVKVKGQCCEQLICPEEAKTERDEVKKHKGKQGKDRMYEDDLTNRNELAPVWGGQSHSLPGEQFCTMFFPVTLLNCLRMRKCV